MRICDQPRHRSVEMLCVYCRDVELYNGNAAQRLLELGGPALTDDQFRDLMRMLRLIHMVLALIAGLLGWFSLDAA